VERKYGSQVAILYRAWPLANHPYAYPLARAAECAAAQGRFVQFHDAAFSLQDSMQYATIPRMVQIVSANAEIPDTSTFNACAAKRDPVLSIENDKNEAQRIQADGTPTVIINGQQIKIAADSVNVGRMIDQVLANSKR
jgi:protein-disulfide isomerase